MKIAKISAAFPGSYEGNELTGEAEASTVRSAISRALASVLKAPELKRKRITAINLAITISNKE